MGAPKGNKFALGLTTTGQPPKYSSPEELEIKCSEYFEHCQKEKQKATITGLALFLGFCSRQSIYDYKENKEYSYVLKRATLAVENSYETNGTAFDIFALKNMGWKDKTEVEQTVTDLTPPKIEYYDPKDQDEPEGFDIKDA
jgi:hypothetical protein